ncbi:MAG: hypothetical protein EPN93_08950 [Spirochaetes bacterium]|nr:MAG: hypothetical protein EPN93_08950 [Spirochaetota bacterium]
MDYFLNHIIEIINLIAVLFFMFFSSYFKKKGENLATKEDIKDITDIIENTKNKYISGIEELKARFVIYSDSNSKIQENARNSLIIFFEDCLLLLSEKLRFNYGNFPADGGKSLFEYQKSTEELFTKIYADHYRILLYFFENVEIKAAAAKIAVQMTYVAEIFRKDFGKVKTALINEMNSKNKEIYENAVIETNEISKQFFSKIVPERDKFHTLFNDYLQTLNKHMGVNMDFINNILKNNSL